jgi:hypothetical protein
MRSLLLKTFIAIMCVTAGACGGAKEPEPAPAAEAAKSAAESVAGGANTMAKGLEDLAKGVREAAEGGKTVEPVSIDTLQGVFPEFSGWTRGKPTGEKMSIPVSFSQATVTYTKSDATIEAKAVDTGFSQLLVAPYAMFLTVGYEKQTESGYEKSVAVAGAPGWEKWDREDKRGEVNMLVGKRFVLTFEGSGIDDTKVLHDLAGRANVSALK